MMRFYRVLFTLIFLISASIPNIYAAGVSSFEFLQIGVGARAQGLGGAYTALSDDINSIYWNQAGLGLMKEKQVSFMHNVWLDSISYDYMAVGVPSKLGTIGLSAHYLNMGDIIGRETQISEPYSFSADDSMVTLGYGRKLIRHGFVGLNVKYIKERIDDVTAEGFAVDFGILYRDAKFPLNFGLSVHNIGDKIKYVKESENLPLDVTFGLAYRIGGMSFGMDFKHFVYERNTDLLLGTEFMPLNVITLRGGMLYNMLKHTSITDSQTGTDFNPSGGIGIKVGKSQFDYSLTPFNRLGTTHKLSLSFTF